MILLEYYCFMQFVLFLVITTYNVGFLGGIFFVKTNLKGHFCSKITSYKIRKVPLKDSQHSLKAPGTHYYPTRKAQTPVVPQIMRLMPLPWVND